MLQRRAIVIGSDQPDYDLGIDKAVELVVSSAMVQAREISISSLTQGRYLVVLPESLAPATLMASLPVAAWANEVTFRSWSPLLDGDFANLEYKVIVQFVGLPPPLRREKAVIRAASTFGVYLGSITQDDSSNLASWTAVVGMHDLALLPNRVLMVAGGVRVPIAIYPLKWIQAPVYQEQEQPHRPIIFKPTIPTLLVHPEEEEEPSDDDVIPLSRTDLAELCRGRQLSSLPDGVRRFLTGKQQVDVSGSSGDDMETTELETTISLGSPEGPQVATENPEPLATGEDTHGDVADQTRPVLDGLHATSTIQPHTIPLTQPSSTEPSLSPHRESRTLTAAEKDGNSCHMATAQSSLETVPILLRRNDNTASPKPKRKFGSMAPSPAQVVQRMIPTEGERIEPEQLFPELTRPQPTPDRPSAELQPDGFYKIHVGYSTCIDMAEVCGVNTNVILSTIEEDNAERAAAFDLGQTESSAGPARQ